MACEDREWELFDCEEDPMELFNVYSDPNYQNIVVKNDRRVGNKDGGNR